MSAPGRCSLLLVPPLTNTGRKKEFVVKDSRRHHLLLAGLQRVRGAIYLSDGAISESSLTPDGRHVQKEDPLSWHILTVNEEDEILGCLRFRAYGTGVTYTDLAVSRTICDIVDIGARVEEAVSADIEEARRVGFLYVELGGWALRQEIRCTTEAVRMLLMTYSLGNLLGGAHGLSTATTRHHSSSILRRLGGQSLRLGDDTIPPYYDPHYGCEMELLRFDSTSPNPRYDEWILACSDILMNCPAVSDTSRLPDVESLADLHSALTEAQPAVSPAGQPEARQGMPTNAGYKPELSLPGNSANRMAESLPAHGSEVMSSGSV